MGKIVLKSAAEIEGIRRAGAVVAEIIERIGKRIASGVGTADLERVAADVMRSRNAHSACIGYKPSRRQPAYPGLICISINDEVVHGIPGKRTLVDGDIVSVDVVIELNGFYSDAAWSFVVGQPSDDAANLMQGTYDALQSGIEQAVAGNRIRDISEAVERTAISYGLGIVRDLVGHGVGLSMHEPPEVPNFVADGFSPVLKEGMTIAIEPMLTLGDWRVRTNGDGWTIRTADRSLAAHYENTVAITNGKADILTPLPFKGAF